MTPLEILRARRQPVEPGLRSHISLLSPRRTEINPDAASAPAGERSERSEIKGIDTVPLSSAPLSGAIAESQADRHSWREIVTIADRVAQRAAAPTATELDRLTADDWRRIKAAKRRDRPP